MAVLEKLRKWGIWLSIAVALPLLLFIIDPSQVIQTIQSISSKYDVGRIEGKGISYTEFESEVARYSAVFEMLNGASANSEEAQKQVRDLAWNSLLDSRMFIAQANKAGIYVEKDELLGLMGEENTSPVLVQSGIFATENAQFSPDALREFLDQKEVDETGRLSLLWDFLMEQVVSARYHEKYNALMLAADFQNDAEQARMIADNNTVSSVDFVTVPFTYTRDTTVTVSSKEIKDYYKAHKEQFFQPKETRDVEYVVFEVKPSAEDVAAANEAFAALYDEFGTTENVRQFLQRNNSVTTYDELWYKAGELASVNSEIDSWVSANRSGVSPVVRAGDDFMAARIMETAAVPDSVYVRYIVLRGAGARNTADSLVNVLGKRGANFSALAEEFSIDKNSAADGEIGNLGWLTQSALRGSGLQSLLVAPKNKPYAVTNGALSYVLEVTKTTAPVQKKKVAVFHAETVASSETANEAYNKANNLASLSNGKYEDFAAACTSAGHYAHPLTINEGTDTYGTIKRAKAVTRWAFDAKPGTASSIITVDQNYFFVAALKDVHKKGYAPVSQVSSYIENTLYADKAAEKQVAAVRERIEGLTDLQSIADALGTTISHNDEVSFATMSYYGGLDSKFVGAVSGAPENVLTGPVAGNTGVYVFNVSGRTVESHFTEDDAATYHNRFAQLAAYRLMSIMQEGTDTEDNRERFY